MLLEYTDRLKELPEGYSLSFYARYGECKRCGQCCVAKGLWSRIREEEKERLRRENPREYRLGDAMAMLGKECAMLIRETGKTRCKIYKQRPTTCRDFPATKDDLIKGCGYSFERIL